MSLLSRVLCALAIAIEDEVKRQVLAHTANAGVCAQNTAAHPPKEESCAKEQPQDESAASVRLVSAWASPSQLAGLPGMPGRAKDIARTCERLKVPRRKRANGRGGGFEYSVAEMPAATQLAFYARSSRPIEASAE